MGDGGRGDVAGTFAVGCILTGDHEADLDCTQFHEDAPWTCCKWCERDGGEHCGMCERFEPDEDDVRNYVSQLWAEDWGSAEDSTYDAWPGGTP